MNLSCFKLLPAILAVLVMTSCNGKAVHDETDIQARNNDISGKSILSGNPPHELTGEVARNLLILGALPATDGASVDKSGETVRAIVKACLEKAGQYKTFSVLDLYISKHVEDPAPIQSAHVDIASGQTSSALMDFTLARRPGMKTASYMKWTNGYQQEMKYSSMRGFGLKVQMRP